MGCRLDSFIIQKADHFKSALRGPRRVRFPRAPLSEGFGALNLPLGGRHGYRGVRKARKGTFQGYTPKKTHTTAAYESAQEAAVALAVLKQNINLGLTESAERKPRAKRALSTGARARRTDIFFRALFSLFLA